MEINKIFKYESKYNVFYSNRRQLVWKKHGEDLLKRNIQANT